MPQTLLALLALASAAFFTLGQKQGSTHTMESIVLDEFEVAVAGSLLNTTEFADSRSFDDATTPERLRVRLGLPQILTQATLDTLTFADVAVPTSQFAPFSRFGLSPAGSPARCDARNQLASVDCDDVSDLHDRKTGGNVPAVWHDVTLTTPNGDPLPVEVHVEVHYVEANAPDVNVSTPTNHKRVDVWARSPTLMRKFPGHAIQMHRVISFDPAVALEYLKRTSCVVDAAQLATVKAAEAAVTIAQAASESANARVETAGTAARTARDAAAAREADLATANAAAATLNAKVQKLAPDTYAAYVRYLDAQKHLDSVNGKGKKRDDAEGARDAAWSAFIALYTPYLAAQKAADAASTAAETARTASVSAWNAAQAAQQALDAATATATEAGRTLATAVARLRTLSQCSAGSPA